MLLSYQVTFTNELCHHGIKGQKWGIRRYRNYDGSYTQAGLKRYYESKDAYENANKKYKEIKKWYKTNKKEPGAKTNLVNARTNKIRLKRRTKNTYKHLKADKMADKGKELYSRGYTIRGKNKGLRILKKIGVLSVGAAAISKYNNGKVPLAPGVYVSIPDKVNSVINKHSKEIAIGGTALVGATTAAQLATANKDRKLRAYYNHTSYRPLK